MRDLPTCQGVTQARLFAAQQLQEHVAGLLLLLCHRARKGMDGACLDLAQSETPGTNTLPDFVPSLVSFCSELHVLCASFFCTFCVSVSSASSPGCGQGKRCVNILNGQMVRISECTRVGLACFWCCAIALNSRSTDGGMREGVHGKEGSTDKLRETRMKYAVYVYIYRPQQNRGHVPQHGSGGRAIGSPALPKCS